MKPRPIVLIILDGWGCRESTHSNAIANANTPVWDSLWQNMPHTTLSASEMDVGLPKGQMGNSEVGHLTMGAGRVIFQDLTRITKAIEEGDFNRNPILLNTFEHFTAEKTLHVLGLLSNGGVHSHEEHLHALIKLAATKGVSKILIHAFLDGRDTPPKNAETSLIALEKLCHSLPSSTTANIASLSGRYYAMDRDKRWERTQLVYQMLTEAKANYTATTAMQGLSLAYARGETDEFVKPTILPSFSAIQDKDVVVFMNFRADRARQLSYALIDPNFNGFPRQHFPKLSEFITLTEYSTDLNAKVVFPPPPLKNTLGEYLQTQKMRQLRIAETEKYAHVTSFFNGGRETLFEKEDRILIPSPKVETYDLCPEMSAPILTKQLVQIISSQTYDVIICNYANADMVGHTGDYKAAIKAVETLDTCLGEIVRALNAVGGEAIITADHGNVEIMFNEDSKQAHTAHTLERVPFVYVGRSMQIIRPNGTLADIAPTLLLLLGIPLPTEMTGKPLLALT